MRGVGAGEQELLTISERSGTLLVRVLPMGERGVRLGRADSPFGEVQGRSSDGEIRRD